MDILPFVELVERAPRVEVNCYITTSPDILGNWSSPKRFKSAETIEEDIILRLGLRLK
jgi:hypothetical protein